MDDIQFALAASTDLGRLYQSAKYFSADAPGQALLFLRGLALKLCSVLDKEFTERDSLEDRIKSLERHGMLRPQTHRNLRTLQRNGNIAAHPEQFSHESHDYHSMAAASLAAARGLIEHIYTIGDQAAPKYDVIEVEQSGLRDMCYLAMMKGDIEAMHQAAVLFKEKAGQVEHLDTVINADNYGFHARPYIDQAMFWFKRGAEQDHVDCMYQYGLYLARTRGADSLTLSRGKRFILQAAESGHDDAQVYVAGCLLDGKGIFEKDLELAREYYEKAADQDHPEALGQLGAIYELGIGCEPDPQAAARYTIRAAAAGFPQGQYNLFVLYSQGTGVERDLGKAMHWLKLASDQDYPAAVFGRANLMQQGMIEGETLRDALALYHRCAGVPDYHARAGVAIAEISLAIETDIERWMDTAVLLQDCYETITRDGDPYDLMGDCLSASARTVGRIRDHVSRNGPDPKQGLNDVLLCCLFDSKGVPVADKFARIGLLNELLSKSNSTRAGEKERAVELLLKEAHIRAKFPAVMLFPDRQQQIAVNAVADSRQGRNTPCQCGSGRKFKKCCGG